MNNILMAISGPSGVGKGTIVKRLLEKRADLAASISCTTRPPREGERDGVEYFFLSEKEFLRRAEEKAFLEYDKHFENYYGTLKSFVMGAMKEKSVILEIDVVGALNAKKEYPQCILVMILPPSEEELKKRLSERNTETKEEIENRLARMQFELAQKDKYDYTVVNDSLDEAVKKISDIIDAEKKKRAIEE